MVIHCLDEKDLGNCRVWRAQRTGSIEGTYFKRKLLNLVVPVWNGLFSPKAPAKGFPQRTAAKFNLSLQLHNISYILSITYIVYTNFIYFTYIICTHTSTSTSSVYISPKNLDVICKGVLTQAFLHRSSYAEVLTQKLLHRSLSQELLHRTYKLLLAKFF